MTLDEALAGDGTELTWRCAHESATGLEVLEIARPGLILLPLEELVPRGVFHEWLYRGAERLLRAYIGFGHLEDHEADWLMQAIAIVATTADPQEQDFEEIRVLALMTAASLNMLEAIRHKPREMGGTYGWARDALGWATKRYLPDRWCPHEPPALNARLVELHGELAAMQNHDRPDAELEEREAQLAGFLEAWAAH